MHECSYSSRLTRTGQATKEPNARVWTSRIKNRGPNRLNPIHYNPGVVRNSATTFGLQQPVRAGLPCGGFRGAVALVVSIGKGKPGNKPMRSLAGTYSEETEQ